MMEAADEQMARRLSRRAIFTVVMRENLNIPHEIEHLDRAS